VLAGDTEAPRDKAAVSALVAQIAEDQGLLPEVGWQGGQLSVVVNNCSFRELSGADPDLVCAMHRAFLEGILQVATSGLGHIEIAPDDCRISCGGERCELRCSFASGGT
jgi:predicted ArsR family transcriptional regulator